MFFYRKLYWKGHKLHYFAPIPFIMGIIVATHGSNIIPIPWLYSHPLNVEAIAAIFYSLSIPLIFRNQISFLESTSARYSLFRYLPIMALIWAIPLILTISISQGTTFLHVTSISMFLVITFGSFFRVDTVMTVLVSGLLISTSLWSSLENTPWRHLLFYLDTPSPFLTYSVAVITFIVSLPMLRQFMRNWETTEN